MKEGYDVSNKQYKASGYIRLLKAKAPWLVVAMLFSVNATWLPTIPALLTAVV